MAESGVVDAATVGDKGRQENALKVITDALHNGSEDQKARLRNALGVGGVITKSKKARKQNNSMARNSVLAYGDVTHAPLPDGSPWSPGPSESMVANMGQHAVAVSTKIGREVTPYQLAKAVTRKKYLEGNDSDGATSTMTSREAEERYGLESVDPDDLALIAQEEFPTDVVAGDLGDIGFDEGSVG
jgi:hypothetical protein